MPPPLQRDAAKTAAYPDFIGIGAQKAGTTWLHRNLQAHPEIWMPAEKELHYFDEKISSEGGPLSRLRGSRPVDKRWRRQLGSRLRRSPRWSGRQDAAWNFRYFFGKPGDAWYASLFEPGRGKVAGEATPDYSILDKDVVAHVHDLMPDARILFMMRSPIERPWSAMDMRLRTRGEVMEQVKDRKFYRRFDNRGSRLRTDYARTLENWGAFYPEDQIFVGFLEDVSFFPGELLERIYAFLGVDTTFKPPGAERKIHAGQRDAIPTRFAVHLARSYHEEIRVLSDRFGGYALFWRYCAERLIEEPPQEPEITYPLFESSLWEEWEGPRRATNVQSGLLSSVSAAS